MVVEVIFVDRNVESAGEVGVVTLTLDVIGVFLSYTHTSSS
jgi:hypothetical protein